VFSGTRWIFLDAGEGLEFIEIANITHIEASEGETRVFLKDGRTRTTARTLADWESRLSSADFVRVHRSAIVNLRFVERVEEWFQYSYRLKIAGHDGHVLMSRRHAARLRDRMG
jgi:DNA-binding LytR/AlgR family response regulator